jgi:predicted methyltransferase
VGNLALERKHMLMTHTRIPILALGLVLAACDQPETSTESVEPATPPAAVSPVATVVEAAGVPAALAEALGTRSEADQARDAGRKPGEVVTFLGISSGMTVLDLFAAAGWYTEVLSHAVGPDGTVYAQNPELLLRMRDGVNEKAVAARLADGRLLNVERLDREISDLGLQPESVDVAMFALNFHDVYNRGGAEAAGGLLQSVYQVLKPGGIFALIDHDGTAENDNAALHRIEKARVLEVIESSPFTLEAESDVLSNPDDDMSAVVFDPEVRGHTNRFVLRLKK